MRRIFLPLLLLTLLCSLTACGGAATPAEDVQQDNAVHYDNLELLQDALGYQVITLEDEDLTLTDCAIQDEAIAVLTYTTSERQTVTLKMTVDEDHHESLSLLSDTTEQVGGVQAPSSAFSALNVYADQGTCFCPITYTVDEYPCYLNLSETDTTFNGGFSDRLIAFVDQLYRSTETPGYVTYLDGIAQAKAAAEKAQEEAEQAQQQEAAQETESSEQQQTTEPEPSEESQTPEPEETEEPEAEAPEEEPAPSESEEEPAESQSASADITLTYYDITLVNVGDSYTFSPSGGNSIYYWKSADTSVATVSQEGTVRAVGVGETTVTCVSGDVSVSVVVRVPGG